MAVDCVRSGHPEYIYSIVEAMATSIENDLATWIAENGGWVSKVFIVINSLKTKRLLKKCANLKYILSVIVK